MCLGCGTPLATNDSHVNCEACRGKNQERNKKKRAHARQEVINAYGGKCACCGESDIWFLTIDHIDGGGRQHRQAIAGGGGDKFYRKLREQGFPNDPPLQVLCWNCNLAKHQRGVCPHQV